MYCFGRGKKKVLVLGQVTKLLQMACEVSGFLVSQASYCCEGNITAVPLGPLSEV